MIWQQLIAKNKCKTCQMVFRLPRLTSFPQKTNIITTKKYCFLENMGVEIPWKIKRYNFTNYFSSSDRNYNINNIKEKFGVDAVCFGSKSIANSWDWRFCVDASVINKYEDAHLSTAKKVMDKKKKKEFAAKLALQEKIKRIYDEHDGLKDALKKNNRIINDIRARLESSGHISQKQIALVMSIASPKTARAPEGRHTFCGEIKSAVARDGYYGTEYKILVVTEDGWKAFGTIPSGIFNDERVDCYLARTKGLKVEITATLKPGSDLDFAYFSRPKGRIL